MGDGLANMPDDTALFGPVCFAAVVVLTAWVIGAQAIQAELYSLKTPIWVYVFGVLTWCALVAIVAAAFQWRFFAQAIIAGEAITVAIALTILGWRLTVWLLRQR